MTTAAPTMPDTLTDEEEVTPADGDAHYVKVRALIEGGPVTALCGKRYVPTTALVEDRRVCPTCDELMQVLRSVYGDS